MVFKRKHSDPAGDSEVVIDAELTDAQSTVVQSALPVPRRSLVPEADSIEVVARRRDSELVVRNVAVATAGGVVVGAATIVLAHAAKSIAKPTPGLARRRRKDVVASQSFMVDVHLLKPR